nr:exodeoxyribonuclease VII small subunit [Rhodospirillales bacterium]|tara:strand:- start:245 stop:511 length:267 start_codon:yes stop_codon:yes gene_type:complete
MVAEGNSKRIMADIKKMSFEDALIELEEIVGNLEQGANKLDDAIGAYERGTLLKKHCETKLSEARARIEKIVVGSDGNVTAEPFDISQ